MVNKSWSNRYHIIYNQRLFLAMINKLPAWSILIGLLSRLPWHVNWKVPQSGRANLKTQICLDNFFHFLHSCQHALYGWKSWCSHEPKSLLAARFLWLPLLIRGFQYKRTRNYSWRQIKSWRSWCPGPFSREATNFDSWPDTHWYVNFNNLTLT